MKKDQIYIVDYAYGFKAATCNVDHVCVLRSQAALRAYKRYPNAKIVLGAGMKKVTGDCGPLSGMMREYLHAHGVPNDAIIENPSGYDTLSETKAAWDIIKSRGGGSVICATSAYHALRVWCIWVFGFGVIPKRFFTTTLDPSYHERNKRVLEAPARCSPRDEVSIPKISHFCR